MASQTTSTMSVSNHAPQATAFHALVNMQQAADAAELRVQDATDETFRNMREALNQSETNNRTLAERLVQAMDHMETLARRVEELESLRRTEKTALVNQMNALERRLEANEVITKGLRANLDSAKANFAGHNHVDGYSGSCHVTCTPRLSLF